MTSQRPLLPVSTQQGSGQQSLQSSFWQTIRHCRQRQISWKNGFHGGTISNQSFQNLRPGFGLGPSDVLFLFLEPPSLLRGVVPCTRHFSLLVLNKCLSGTVTEGNDCISTSKCIRLMGFQKNSDGILIGYVSEPCRCVFSSSSFMLASLGFFLFFSFFHPQKMKSEF